MGPGLVQRVYGAVRKRCVLNPPMGARCAPHRYSLYARTRLGFLFYKRQVKKARERFPHGHSVSQPLGFHGEF